MNMKSKSTLEKMRDKLRFRNYSEQTIKTYISYAKKYLMYFNKDVYHISVKEAEQYLMEFDYSSVSQQNQIISSVKFLYFNVVGRKLNTLNIIRPRKEKHLPQVMDKGFVLNQISKIDNLKHKSIISLAFSVGLRVSEVINLKIEDIDSKRMIINIRQAKGNKDRVVPLSKIVLDLLRDYYNEYRPKEYLFNGQFTNQYSSTSCNQLVKKYLGEEYHFHTLRHSSFTSMLELGVDLRLIQKIAGHNNVKTTEIYTHVSNQILNRIELPI